MAHRTTRMKADSELKPEHLSKSIPAPLMVLVYKFLLDNGYQNIAIALRDAAEQKASDGSAQPSAPDWEANTSHTSLLNIFSDWESGRHAVGEQHSPKPSLAGGSDRSSVEIDRKIQETFPTRLDQVEGLDYGDSVTSEGSSEESEDSEGSDSDDEASIRSPAVVEDTSEGDSSSTGESESSESESDSSDEEGSVNESAMNDEGTVETKPDLSTSFEPPILRNRKRKLSMSSVSSSSSSSSSSEDSDSVSGSRSGRSSAPNNSDEPSSESDSDPESDSESDPSDEDDARPVKRRKVEDHESTSDDSDIESASDSEVSNEQMADVAEIKKNSSDSSVTIARTSPEFKKIKAFAAETQQTTDDSALGQTDTRAGSLALNGKVGSRWAKKTNEPFRRVAADQAIDPRFASNAYVKDEYGEKAYRDLRVTRGDRFTKEKNKKKRGAYHGGRIDTSARGIRFDD